MTTKFKDYVTSKGQKLAELSNEDIYVALLHYVKELADRKNQKIQLNAKFTTFLLNFLSVNFCQIT